jgi:hypothetical protein
LRFSQELAQSLPKEWAAMLPGSASLSVLHEPPMGNRSGASFEKNAKERGTPMAVVAATSKTWATRLWRDALNFAWA